MNTTLLIVALCVSFGSVTSLPSNWNNRLLRNPKAKDEDTCTNCKEILAGVIARLETEEGVSMVEQFVNDEICAYLTPYVSYESCSSAVHAHVPGLLQYFVDNADPEVWYSVAHLCPETLTSQFKKSREISVDTGDNDCTDCKEAVGSFIASLDTDEVKASVEQYINDVVCSQLSAYFLEEVCTTEVRALIPEVLNYIVENLDPEEVCTLATLCPEKDEEKSSKALFKKTFPKQGDSSCTDCKEAVAGFIVSLNTDEAKASVEQYINDVVCSQLSAYFLEEVCTAEVRALIPEVLNYIVENLDPEEVCTLATLCPEKDEEKSSKALFKKTYPKQGDSSCTDCKEAVAGFIVSLNTDEAKASVEQYINDVVCSQLSAYFLEEVCTAEVRALIPEVLNYIVENLDPEEVCTLATLCPEKDEEKSSKALFKKTYPKQGDSSCTDCKEAVAGFIVSLNTDEAKASVEQYINDVVCSQLSAYFLEEVCTAEVRALIPEVLNYIVENLDPEEVCTLATLCPEKDEEKSSKALFKKTYPKQGDSSCTDCKEAVAGFIVSLNTDEAKASVEQYINDVVCSQLSAYFLEEVCTAEVRALIPEVLNYIVENLDPEEVCTLATLCPEKDEEKSSKALFKKTYPKQGDSSCTDCKEAVAGFIVSLNTDEAKASVEQYINDVVCSQLSAYFLEEVCTAEVRALIPEVLNYIVENLDPEEVCTLATLCPEKDEEKSSKALFKKTYPKQGDSSCTDCKEAVAGFIVSLNTDEAKASVEQYINDVVCSQLSAYFLEEVCTAEVRALIPEVLNYIVENLDPEEVCTLATLCPEKDEEKSSKALFKKTYPKQGDSSCTDCKEAVAGFIVSLNTDEAKASVEQYINDVVCSQLSAYFLEEVCTAEVRALIPEVLNYIVENLDPEEVCTLATLCPEKDEEKSSKALFKKTYPKQGDSSCTDCKEAVAGFIVSLNTDEAKASVEQYINDVVCSQLSAYFLEEVCTAEVRALIPEVLNYIVENLDPEEVCTLATLCPEKDEEKSSKALFKKTYPKQGDSSCTDCKEAVAGFIVSLNTDEAKASVEQYINDVVCSQLSAYFLEEVCTAEVRALIPEVLNYIVENLDPEEVCTLATLCPEKDEEKSSKALFKKTYPKQGDSSCTDCKEAVADFIVSLNTDEAKASVEQYINDVVCSQLSAYFLEEVCTAEVRALIPEVLNYIVENLDPEEVCTLATLCPEKVGEKSSNALFTKYLAQQLFAIYYKW